MLQHMNEDAAGVVLMQDKRQSVFVAIGEYFSSDYTPERFISGCDGGRRVIRVVLKACTRLQLLLPFPVVNRHGRVICRTMEEAFEQKVAVWWMEDDAVVTCVDGATHSP